MVCQQERFPSSAGKVPIIIEQDDDGASQRLPGFVTDFSHNLTRNIKQGDGTIATQVGHLPTDTSYELNFFKAT